MLLQLVRRWSVDWLNGQHPEVCADILGPEYTLLIGGFRLGPRAEYVPATLAQLARYPGLVVTVHQVVNGGDLVAVAFSEHGASARLMGRAAVWSGIAVFGWDGARLTRCFAEEDYYGRRRQLDSGFCDAVDRPAAAPWDTPVGPPDASAEAVVRAWLGEADLRSVPIVCDDEYVDQPESRILDVESCREDVLFSAGEQVAFHVAQGGRYVGGLDGLDDLLGAPASLELSGIVTVRGGRVVGGRVIRDRLGLARNLRSAAAARA